MKSINEKQIKEIDKEIKELKEKQDDLSSEVEGLEDELDEKRDELENLEFKIELLNGKADGLKYIDKFFKASAKEQKAMAIDKLSENRYTKGQFKIGGKWYITNLNVACRFEKKLGGVEDTAEGKRRFEYIPKFFSYPKTKIELKTSQIPQLETLPKDTNVLVKVGDMYVNKMYLHYVAAALSLDDTAEWYAFRSGDIKGFYGLLVEQGVNSAMVLRIVV